MKARRHDFVGSMIEIVCDLVSWVLLAGGCFFCIAGGIGIIRLPDVYCRAHAAGLTDTLGAGLILVGLMFQAASLMVIIKLFFVLSFLMLTSPTGTHALTAGCLHARDRSGRGAATRE